jgi:Sortilin, neurotensin receptor 3, C-terminal
MVPHKSDYNFVRQNGKCVAAGPEPIPPGVCPGEHENEKYKGSSGYRLIPGNTCRKEGGMTLDTPVVKDCSKGIAIIPPLLLDYFILFSSHFPLFYVSSSTC